MEHFHFWSKPRHVTPEIHHLGENEPYSKGVSRHIYGFLRR